MTGEIERRRQPLARRHIELSAAVPPELGDRHHRPLKRRRVERDPVPHPSKVGQVEHHGAEPRELPWKRNWAAEDEDGGGGGSVALPVKEGEEEDHGESGEEGLVGGQESEGGRDPAAVEAIGRRCGFHHWIGWLSRE